MGTIYWKKIKKLTRIRKATIYQIFVIYIYIYGACIFLNLLGAYDRYDDFNGSTSILEKLARKT